MPTARGDAFDEERLLQIVGMDDPPLRLLLGRDVFRAYREKTAA